MDAKSLIESHNDTALLITHIDLDEKDAGKALLHFVREQLHNDTTRLILTTDGIERFPEADILATYDIHDCRLCNEFLSAELQASVLSALRTFQIYSACKDLETEFENQVEERTFTLKQNNKQLKLSLSTLEEDHEAGKRIQYKLLPERRVRLDNYEFSRYLLSSTMLSGDFLDYFKIDDQNIGFYIADVSGHGISSAFITVLLNNFIHNFLKKYSFEKDNTIMRPDVLLRTLNEEFLQENLGKYFTMFYGIINIDNNTMSFANGGQFPAPIVYSKAGVSFDLLKSWQKQDTPLGTKYSPTMTKQEVHKTNTGRISVKGKPVGLFHDIDYTSYQMILPEEFLILMVSDGILEVLPHKSLKDKLAYLDNVIKDLNTDIDTLMEKISIKDHERLPDDITFLMIKRRLGE
jgi:serine phosphatase RsbU (regulator of sigma subunit)